MSLRILGTFVAALLLGALASAETREVTGFVGSKIQVFDENFKPAGSVEVSSLSGVSSATKHESRPFYQIAAGGQTYWVLGSKINFKDMQRTDQIVCNTRKAEFEPSTFNSTMGSGEKKDCVPAGE